MPSWQGTSRGTSRSWMGEWWLPLHLKTCSAGLAVCSFTRLWTYWTSARSWPSARKQKVNSHYMSVLMYTRLYQNHRTEKVLDQHHMELVNTSLLQPPHGAQYLQGHHCVLYPANNEISGCRSDPWYGILQCGAAPQALQGTRPY